MVNKKRKTRITPRHYHKHKVTFENGLRLDNEGRVVWLSEKGTAWGKKDIPYIKAAIKGFEDEYNRCPTGYCRRATLKEISDYQRYLKIAHKLPNQIPENKKKLLKKWWE